jgi:hypothetical protein
MKHNLEIGSAPLWAWAIVGWLGAGTVGAFWTRGTLGRMLLGAPVVKVIDWDLETMSPRELRALPGIGKTRAVDIAKARWAAPNEAKFDMRVVPGIGEVTAKRASEFLSGRRTRVGPRERDVPIPPPN